jgi:hypothetical protein
MITKSKALQIRKLMMQSAQTLDDVNASSLPEAFPTLNNNGMAIPAGTRINWNGKIRKAKIDLFDISENNPDNSPEKWEIISYKNGIRDIQDTIDSALSFAAGKLGVWNGEIYESLYDNNIWNPVQFPAGWKKK